MFNQSSIEAWMPIIGFALVLISLGVHRLFKNIRAMTWQETLTNLSIFLVWRYLFYAAGVALQLIIFSYVANLVPWKLPSNGWVFLLAVFMADFCYYWKHRYEHEINLLWCQHSVHHSSEEFNLSTSVRLPWVGSYLNWGFFVPALLFGFSAKQIILGHQVVLAYQYLIHTEIIRKIGFLESLLNTPSHHRVHHGRNEAYLDKNYGGILIVWDKLFGTFIEEKELVEYGLVHPLRTKNPIMVNWHPWRELFLRTKEVPLLRDKVKLLFIAPAVTDAFLGVRKHQ
ncbi:MAG: sterol desaturase family protein [Bacillota bacterium]